MRPLLTHRRRTRPSLWLAVAAMLVVAAPTRADDDGPRGPWALEHASATWGQLVSSQLDSERPTSFWSLAVDLPLVERLGLSTQLRFDSIVFGHANQVFSRLVHPGRTDYSIAVRWMPHSWIGAEIHHVSSHRVELLHDSQQIDFESEIGVGGASNFFSLLLRSHAFEVRTGLGGQWTDTNTGPILMDIQNVLLNSRTAKGPFVSARMPFLDGDHGRSTRIMLNAVVVTDAQWRAHPPAEGTHVTWGVSIEQPLIERVQLGLSYAGNNGTPMVKRANNAVGVYLRLRWWFDGE